MKTEKEKMLAGEPYDCGDTELINRWHKAKQLQKEYSGKHFLFFCFHNLKLFSWSNKYTKNGLKF